MTSANIMPAERIEQKIFVIRGEKVMLDSDLAQLYKVETRVLNQAVKRNSERFPSDFMFHLTREEIQSISQFVTSSPEHEKLKYSKRVTVFTEYGVAMLSSVLNSPRAIQVNIQIMRTFGKLREMAARNTEMSRRLNALEKKYDAQFKVVFDAIRNKLMPPVCVQRTGRPPEKPRRRIGFRNAK